ncbi:MAG: hypothetical protein PHV06_03985 [bacterium]|nr:hypothetical protein [bacterium]
MKREIWIGIQISFLFIVFSILSFLLFLSAGKSKKLLINKLKTGAYIISLTALLTGSCTSINPPAKCYVPVIDQDPGILIDKQEQQITEKLIVSKDRMVKGWIQDLDKDSNYIFKITTGPGKVVQEGDIDLKTDKVITGDSVFFEIKIDKSLEPGLYFMDIYKEGIDKSIRKYVFELEE